ncbi:MAG: iron-containing alcohol dehydrogenase family protein [Nitrospirota bacterium]
MNSPSHHRLPTPRRRPSPAGLIFPIALLLAIVAASSQAQLIDLPEHSVLQERIGARIQALGRYDLQRLNRIHHQWNRVARTAADFNETREMRRQESLGHTIAAAARAQFVERSAIETSLADSRGLRDAIRSGAWRQEHLGLAIVRTAAALAPGDPRFRERLRARGSALIAMESRVGRRADTRVAELSGRLAQLPRDELARLADAVTDGHRTAHLYDTAHDAWVVRAIRGLQDEMDFTRSTDDYRRVADDAKAALAPRWGVGGFWEFGAAALAGIVMTMTWFGATTPGDVRRTSEQTPPVKRRPSPHLTRRREGAMAQSTILFSWPREVVFGNHCARDIGRYAARDAMTQAMILTDAGVVRQGLAEPVRTSLAESGLRCDLIDKITSEVPHTFIGAIANRCREARADVLIAVGGGSVIDTAKAVGILLTNGGEIQDYEGIDRVTRAITPLYVVPTMAGSGGECSQFCIVLDTARKKKIEIFSRKLIPDRIFIDPTLTRSMPPELTAGSGMDALANAIEAYCSTWGNALTDSLALDAIRLIADNLRTVVANGQHAEGRQHMALAAFEAGLAFTNAQSGAVHALGHSLSGLFDIPQRVGDAILLPHVMQANINADMPRMAKVAEVLGEPIADLSVRAAAQKAVDAVKLLLADVGLPATLDKVGADRNAISTLSEQALQDTFMRTNPRALNFEEIEVIYEDAFGDYAEVGSLAGRRAPTTH